MMFKYQDHSENYFLYKEGAIEPGPLVIQFKLSTDNLTQFLKNPKYIRDENLMLLRDLWENDDRGSAPITP